MRRTHIHRLRAFRRWLQQLSIDGKSQYVHELEMWLKSFERYFRPANLPFTDEEKRQSTLRDYSEELKVVHDVIFRISQVCTLLLSEEQISYSSFAKYVENSLKQDFYTDSYIRKLIRHQRPQTNLNLLMEGLLDIRTTILELSQLDKVSFLCFSGIGRMINRELRKGVFIDFLLEKRFAALFDKVTSPHIVGIVRSIQIPRYKRALASVFFEFYRVLRYLHCVGLQMQDAHALKRSLLIFSLVHAELHLLMEYMRDEFLRKEQPDLRFSELTDHITFSLSMELKKVMQRELLDTAALQQYDLIYTKVQNSQGMLLNGVQEVVFSLAQFFKPGLKGQEIFPGYVTRLEQSLKLRKDICALRDYLMRFEKEEALPALSSLVRRVEWFRANSMRYLMYRDWPDFDDFYHEIRACRTTRNLTFMLHRFKNFLATLLQEVNKRAVLQNHPSQM